MKKNIKLLLSTIGLLSISTITIASVISCGNNSNSTTKSDNNTSNQQNNSNQDNPSFSDRLINNALTTYFSNPANKSTLISYLLNNNCITYSNGTWKYDANNGYKNWSSALSAGVSYLINNNIGVSYNGILGSNINVNDLSVASVSYTNSRGITFNLAYNGASANNSITISSTNLSNYINNNLTIANTLMKYFSNDNNQSALINFLLEENYITCSNWIWNYSSYYNSWTSALSAGVKSFISKNQDISYEGILGSNINSNGVSVTNASYSASDGLIFSIAYNGINVSNSIKISSTILNSYGSTNLTTTNALNTYFSNTNNQMTLITYLLNNGYIIYSNGIWNYNSSAGYTNWDDALSSGIGGFISNYSDVFYGGILGSKITGNISISDASYNNLDGLVFNLAYNGNSTSDNIAISSTTLSNAITNSLTIANNLTTYFNNVNNQIALVNNLINQYITYTNGTWSFNTDEGNWDDSLSSGIETFVSANSNNTSYNGTLSSNINIDSISVVNASYSNSTGLVFNITYNGISANNNVKISSTTLNNYIDNIFTVANTLTNYFNNSNNQIALINYLLNNDYITHSNEIWNYNTNSSSTNENAYTSWADALSAGITEFLTNYSTISYDGILGTNFNSSNISITTASYSTSNGLVFNIQYNNFNASSNVNISSGTLNDSININNNLSNLSITNDLIAYFSDTNNQIALINYLLNNSYITYSDGIWDYDSANGYTSWSSTLNNGISKLISNYSNISYGGILGSNIRTNDISITTASYNSASGLVFNIAYNSVSGDNNITISSATLNNLVNNNLKIVNNITGYFNNVNNQMVLINYLVNNNYITYSDGTWNYENNYNSWAEVLNSMLLRFIESGDANIYYNGVSILELTGAIISIASASYSTSNGLVFNITYNNISGSNVVISASTLNNYASGIANALNTYFSNVNNQIALVNYLLNNNYLTYSDGIWNYNGNNGYTSWDDALSAGISGFISNYANASYDGILGSDLNGTFAITNASYSTSSGLVFNINYNGVSVNDNLTIDILTLNQSININNNNPSNLSIANALNTYFNDTNNQIALVNYLINNSYLTYSSGTLNYADNYISWSNALSFGINSFVTSINHNISFDGILGLYINGTISINSASYSASGGLTFNIGYNNTSTSNNITISAIVLNNYLSNNLKISNALTTYFNNTNNQNVLVAFLLNNNYVTYDNGTWNYYDNNEYGDDDYTSWDNALSYGIQYFVLTNSDVTYDSVFGSDINNNDILINNASYSASSGLVFSIAYNDISANSSVTISATTLDDYVNTNLVIVNTLDNYFNNENNQIALINYLVNNYYVTYSNGIWNYNDYENWTSTLSSGMLTFISANSDVSYDGIIASNLNTNSISVSNATYSVSNGLTFNISYNGVNSSNNISISSTTLSNYINKNNSNPSNFSIINGLTTYFNNVNNQIALMNYLLNNNYLVYSNGTWNYDSKNYSSWTNALNSGISSFISNNSNISYNGVLGSKLSSDYISITNASYSTSSGLVFSIDYNGVSVSDNIVISGATLSNYMNNNLTTLNALISYFSETVNQTTLINYLLNNDYITYFNDAWSYNSNSGYTSWSNALTFGIKEFLFTNSNVSYGENSSSYISSKISINNASYSTSNGLVFSISYSGVNTSDDVIISSTTLSNYVDSNLAIANALTTYFNNVNNQFTLITFLLDGNYIKHSNWTWNYEINYGNWANALNSGIEKFISNYNSISYDGISGSYINGNISIISASYSTSNGLVFNITYNDINGSNNVTISSGTLNNYLNNI